MALVAVVLLTCVACTYNTIQFDEDSISVEYPPAGEGGVSSGDDSGGNEGAGGGGSGKLSPGLNPMIDGHHNLIFNINQGGETPSQTTPTVTVEPSAIPGG